MTYDYYAHRSGGKVFDYFGGIGRPFRIGIVMYYFMKIFGWRVSKILSGAPVQVLMVNATIKNGAHPRSHAVKEIIKEYKNP